MKVAIIGTGRMGRGFAAALAPSHEVTVGSRDPDRARKTAAATVSFPSRKREREALKGTSTAEHIQRRLPAARVVKGWNHVHAQHLTAPEVNGIAASVLVGMMLFVRLGPLRVLSPS